MVPGIVLPDPLELLPLPVPVVLSVVLGLLGDMLPLVPEVPELAPGLLGEVVLPEVLPPLPMSLWLPLPDVPPPVPEAPDEPAELEPEEVSGLPGLLEDMLPGGVEEVPLLPLVVLQLVLDPVALLVPGGQSVELLPVPVVAEEPLLSEVPLEPALLPLVPLVPLLSLPMLLPPLALPVPLVPDGLAVALLEP